MVAGVTAAPGLSPSAPSPVSKLDLQRVRVMLMQTLPPHVQGGEGDAEAPPQRAPSP